MTIKNNYVKYDRLLKLLEYTEKREKEGLFNFKAFVLNNNGLVNSIKEITCDSTCCFIGNMPLAFPKLRLLTRLHIGNEDNRERIRTFLGINADMYCCLFYGNAYVDFNIERIALETSFPVIKERYLRAIELFNNIKK